MSDYSSERRRSLIKLSAKSRSSRPHSHLVRVTECSLILSQPCTPQFPVPVYFILYFLYRYICFSPQIQRRSQVYPDSSGVQTIPILRTSKMSGYSYTNVHNTGGEQQKFCPCRFGPKVQSKCSIQRSFSCQKQLN